MTGLNTAAIVLRRGRHLPLLRKVCAKKPLFAQFPLAIRRKVCYTMQYELNPVYFMGE